MLTDPVFQARRAGAATALFGGNELAETYSSDWARSTAPSRKASTSMPAAGELQRQRRGPDTRSRGTCPTGRAATGSSGGPAGPRCKGWPGRGRSTAAIHIGKPINGLVSVVDQSRCGVLLYTDEGLFVDAVFPDGRRFAPDKYGVYPQPGEFFAGCVYPHRQNGKIYFGMGKVSPLVYEAEGWSLQDNPARPLTTLDRTVTITADRIASPPEIALAVRGGAGTARLARWAPAIGGAVLDGSLAGWESCDPVRFAADRDRTVEVRLLYDRQNLYLRWHARLGCRSNPKPLRPLERIFAHDRLADTFSVYLQGDPRAASGGSPGGRPGDVRIVFGVFRDGDQTQPVALGLYPRAPASVTPNPITYQTPVRKVEFAHVGPLAGARLSWVPDADERGLVLVAAIPRTAIPDLPPLRSGLRTMVNFEATLAGHNKFWWSNADGSACAKTYDEPTEASLYPGSWAPAQFLGIEQGVLVRNWQILRTAGRTGCREAGGGPPRLDAGQQPRLEAGDARVLRGPRLSPGRQDRPDRGVPRRTGRRLLGPARRSAWRKVTVEDLDTRVKCGIGGQVYYGATWINVPAETELELRFQGHPQTYLRWFLNGQLLETGAYREEPAAPRHGRRQERDAPRRLERDQVPRLLHRLPAVPRGTDPRGGQGKLWTVRLSDTPPGPA